MDELYNLPLIGDDTPSFTANTTHGPERDWSFHR
jgi:hypothetical protein